MKIAIIGAGFCGLAAAWNLIQKDKNLQIEIFDGGGVGGGASGIAAGLLHPYGGAHAKLNWMGLEGVQATKELLEISSQAMGCPVSKQQGVLRLALTDQQKNDFFKAANKYSDIEWLDADACQALVPGLAAVPGILIKSGISVYSKQYLEGLWCACSNKGVTFNNISITNLSELSQFDVIVIAIGAGIALFPEASGLSLNYVKGQVLELEWPQSLNLETAVQDDEVMQDFELESLPMGVDHSQKVKATPIGSDYSSKDCVNLPSSTAVSMLKPPPLPLNSQAYLIMGEDGKTCLAGATFERDFTSDKPDPSVAMLDILPKVEAYYPGIREARLIKCHAGVRVSAPNHHPIAKRLKDNCWIMTGMGSKGLLYHALIAKKLAEDLLRS